MHIDLYVAVFDFQHNDVRQQLTSAVATFPELADGLANLSIFTRMDRYNVELAIAHLSENAQVDVKAVRIINIDHLKRFLPKLASWKVVTSAETFQFPETVLNTKFASYLDVMVPAGSASVFFIPQSRKQADDFAQAMSSNSTLVMRTQMSPADVDALRASLKATR